MNVTLLIAVYLAAIVIANLVITAFGPSATIATAFVFIGLDITARDRLHEAWRQKNLWIKMAALIASGSILSWAVNRNAGPVALASFVAFALSGAADALSYHSLRKKRWLVKVNGSNLVSAAVDSVAFPTLAFGAFMPWVILGQFLAKVAGGAVWAFILGRRRELEAR